MATNIDERLNGNGLLGPIKTDFKSILHEKFLQPPFSVLNTREGDWQSRKRKWRALGIKSEEGRDDNLTYSAKLNEYRKGSSGVAQTSVFDPNVCELCYKWFCPSEGIIVDPFAGGSVRGIVASVLDYKYWGNDLSKKQIASNKAQINERTRGKYRPKWFQGDSNVMLEEAPKCDFIFSCPPYGDLETYSDHEADISNKEYEVFMLMYSSIIGKALAKLKNNRFAAFVVANFRDPKTGIMRDFVGDTIKCFEEHGAYFYNDIILINCAGTAPLRANNTFVRGHRKVVKLHQNILVFCKGDHKKASQKITKQQKEEI